MLEKSEENIRESLFLLFGYKNLRRELRRKYHYPVTGLVAESCGHVILNL